MSNRVIGYISRQHAMRCLLSQPSPGARFRYSTERAFSDDVEISISIPQDMEELQSPPLRVHVIKHWYKWRSDTEIIESEQVIKVAEYPSGRLVRIDTVPDGIEVVEQSLVSPGSSDWRNLFGRREVE